MRSSMTSPLAQTKLILTICIVLVLAILAATWPMRLFAQAAAPPANDIQSIAVPSYFYPGALWTQMEMASPTVSLAIINPNSGPGLSANPDYAAQVAHSQTAGLTVIGYVHTSYGSRSIDEVQAEIDAYYSFYPTLDGIFLDEVAYACALVDDPPAGNRYYRDLYEYIKAKGGKALTVINPGAPTNECYVAASDIIVTFEGTYSSYLNSYVQASWVTAYNPSRFWHLIYDTATVGDMRNALALSKARHAGWVYVTPDLNTGEWLNPWDTLPTSFYWEAELNGVRPRRAVWMYGFGDPQWDSAVKLDFLFSMGVNQVFLSLNVRKIDVGNSNYSATYTTALVDLINQARLRGISIHAMTLQDPVFTYTAHHASGVALVQNVLAYNSAHPGATLAGVHIDAEPHALQEWKDGDWTVREALMQQYVALLSDIRNTIGPKGGPLEFSAAIAWWYNEQAVSGNLPSGAATTLAQHLDVLAPMIYDDLYNSMGGSAADIISRTSDEVGAAPTIIGIGALDLGTYANVAATAGDLTAQLAGSVNYLGTSTFGYDSLPVWPINASNTADYLVNDRNRLSSTFGPRQKASAGYRYDWHRGIDLPADCNTPVHAIADGTVTKAGVTSGYEDRMVQVRHARPGGGYFYSNYLHLTSVVVAENVPVTAGQIIAYSGETGIEDVSPTCDADPAGGFDHLHFEIRSGGVWQENAVHPLTRLAYPDLTAPQVSIVNVSTANPLIPNVDVHVELPPDELDLNRVEVVLFNNSGANPVEIARRTLDMQQWTALYTPHPDGTSIISILDTAPAYDGVYDGDYGAGPVSPAPAGVTVRPARYGYEPRSDRYRIDFTFILTGTAGASSYLVRATTVDINGNLSADSVTMQIDTTPPSISASATKTDNTPYTADTWTNQTVTVHFTCSDGGSGVASCPADQVFSADGVTDAVNGTATDNAGNSASTSFGAVKIDKSLPTIIASATKADSTAYTAGTWTNQTVTVHFTCSDGGSGVASCPADQVFSADGVTDAVNGTATDNAGNSASATFGPVQIDKSVPDTIITGQPTNPSPSVDASFAFNGSDALSSVAAFECSLDNATFTPCTSPQNYTGLTNGAHIFQVRAIDNAGNLDDSPASATWSIQTQPVSVEVTIKVADTSGGGRAGYLVRVYAAAGNEIANSWSNNAGLTIFHLTTGNQYGYLVEKNGARSAKTGFTVAAGVNQTLTYNLAAVTINVGRPGYLVRVYNGANGGGSEWGNAWSDASGNATFHLVEGDYGFLVEKNGARSAKTGFTVAAGVNQTLTYNLAAVTINVGRPGYLVRIYNGVNGSGSEWGNAWSDASGNATFHLVEGDYGYLVEKNGARSAKTGFTVAAGASQTLTYNLAAVTINVGRPGYLVRIYNGVNGIGSEWGNAWSDASGNATFHLVEGDYGYLVEKNGARSAKTGFTVAAGVNQTLTYNLAATTINVGRPGYLVRIYNGAVGSGSEWGNAWSDASGNATFHLVEGDYGYLVEKNGARSAKTGFTVAAGVNQTLTYNLAAVTINVGRPGYLVRIYNGAVGSGSEWGNAWSDASGNATFHLVEGDYGYLVEKNGARSAKTGFTVAAGVNQTLTYTLAAVTVSVGRPGYLVRIHNGVNGSGSEWGNAWSDASGNATFHLVEGDYGYLVEKNGARSAKTGFTVAAGVNQTLTYNLAAVTVSVGRPGYLVRIYNGVNGGGSEWGNAWSDASGNATFHLVEGDYGYLVEKNGARSAKTGFTVAAGLNQTLTYNLAAVTISVGRPGYLVRIYNGANGSGSEWGNAWSDASGNATFHLVEGDYGYLVEKNGARSAKTGFTVAAGVNQTLTYNLAAFTGSMAAHGLSADDQENVVVQEGEDTQQVEDVLISRLFLPIVVEGITNVTAIGRATEGAEDVASEEWLNSVERPAEDSAVSVRIFLPIVHR
jgi:murein DD-endopeptidase MepM/ murein hydrolase activator NlpD/opacity protein-like surface antigen